MNSIKLARSLPRVVQDFLRTKLNADVESSCRSQQLPATVCIQLVTLEAIRVNLWQEVGADVTGDEARMGDDFTQEGNVVGHSWREDDQTSLQKENQATVL